MPPELPPALRAAHGRDERPARLELNLSRIVAAAIEVADADGLSGVSMARVAKRLGFATMSLYRHVGSKDELLTHLQDAAVGPAPDIDPDTGWQAGLTDWTKARVSAYLRHPWNLEIPITGPPLMPRELEWIDRGLQIMADLPLLSFEQLMTLSLLSGYARQQAGQAISIIHDESVPADREHLEYEAALRQITDADRFPTLYRLVHERGLFELPDGTDGDAFMADYGLERILDGIAVLVERRTDA